jgi:hypothetical protein
MSPFSHRWQLERNTTPAFIGTIDRQDCGRRRSELEARSLRRLVLPRGQHGQFAELDGHNFPAPKRPLRVLIMSVFQPCREPQTERENSAKESGLKKPEKSAGQARALSI